MFEKRKLQDELGRFADLDSSLQITEMDSDFLVSFSQLGEGVELRLDIGGGRVIERRNSIERRHASYKGLLGSEHFGNLRRFVEAQRALLTRDAPYLFHQNEQLPVFGAILQSGQTDETTGDVVRRLDFWLVSERDTSSSQRTLIIDGPAGVGKTHVIRSLMYRRLESFGPASAPPILHVQSRGRKLTTLNDVIAGTLNSMRVAMTYEQLPVLARYGLIDIAIDGFDELADPHGYETAWGSLRDLIEDILGSASLILAGRDTFIDAHQVKRSLPMLDTSETAVAHLQPLPKSHAKQWLENRGVSDFGIRSLEDDGLLESESYALRPFFVLQIEKIWQNQPDLSGFLEYPLRSLVGALLLREAKLLVTAIRSLDERSLVAKLEIFFQEVARDMADGERDWVDEATLTLISDLTFENAVSSDELGMLRHRVSALAFLEQDVVPGRRRFPHSEILNFFLCNAYLKLLATNDVPKSVRRNIFGLDLLESFHDVAATHQVTEIIRFLKSSEALLTRRSYDDRSRANVASLLLAAAADIEQFTGTVRVSSIALDEVCVRGVSISLDLFDVSISKIDCRAADMRLVLFNQCDIYSLVGDERSVFPPGFPRPASLSFVDNGQIRTIYDSYEINDWMLKQSEDPHPGGRPSHALLILDKLCRMILQQNWIRDAEDDRAGRTLSDPLWPAIKQILEEENLLSFRFGVGVGGPRSDFMRINQAKKLLEPPNDSPEFRAIRDRVAAVG